MCKKIAFIIISVISLNCFAQKKQIIESIESLEKIVNQGEQDSLKFILSNGEGGFNGSLDIRYRNIIGRDSLNYSLKPESIEVINDYAKVIAFEKVMYRKFQRVHLEASWKTIELKKKGGNWHIKTLNERIYMQSLYTTIDSHFYPKKNEMEASAELDVKILLGGENNLLFQLNRGLKIHYIKDSEGNQYSFERNGQAIVVKWDKPLNKGNEIKLNFKYSGNFFNESQEQNYSLVNIGESACFSSWGGNWYPRVNGTKTKSKATLTYTVPKGLQVASNGILESKQEVGERVTYKYNVTKPLDYTFNANKFIHFQNEYNDIQVNVFLINGTLEKAEMYAKKSTQIIKTLVDFYGIPFPADSYTISEIPSSIAGILGGSSGQGHNFYPENKLRDTVFEFPLFTHEIGHSWWGNWVDGDINLGEVIIEGFAQLNSILCYKLFFGDDEMWEYANNGGDYFPISIRSYFTEFNNTNDVALGVYDEKKSNEIRRLSYIKASFIYAMLMETTGFNSFQSGMRRIMKEYKYKRFDLKNLQEIMEEESGKDLEYFFEQWFKRAGAPEFKTNYSVKKLVNGKYKVSGEINQLREIYKVNAELLFANDNYFVKRKLFVDSKTKQFEYTLNFKPTSIQFDPNRKILRWASEYQSLPIYSQGVHDVFTGNTKEGIKKLIEFLDKSPFNLQGHLILGIGYLYEKEYKNSEKHLKFVIEELENSNKSSMDKPVAYAHLGKLYAETNRHDLAKHYYSEVLKMVNIEGSHQMAREYFASKKL